MNTLQRSAFLSYCHVDNLEIILSENCGGEKGQATLISDWHLYLGTTEQIPHS